MPTSDTAGAVLHRLIPVCVGLAVASLVQAQSGRDASLSRAVGAFLETWLAQGNPQGAVVQHLSPLLADERFVPPSVAPAAEIRRRQSREWILSSHPMDPQTLRKQMAQYLAQVQQGIPPRSLPALLMPFTLQDAQAADENLGRILRTVEPRLLPSVPALVYRVQRPQDIGWIASGTVGYDTLLPGLMDREHLNVQAVVTRTKVDLPPDQPFLLVMLWAERAAELGEWKLLGVEVPPIQ